MGGRRSNLQSVWFMTVLVMVYSSHMADRVLVSALSPLIGKELSLSDSQLGALTGLSFAVMYALGALPIARLAEYYNRIVIIGVSLVVWSVGTALCGLASTFPQLLLLRMSVGLGEAGWSPAANSLIADRFPRERRATALSVLGIGACLGSLLGAFGGGWVALHYGWQAAFIAAGVPGLFLALLVFLTVREPPRGAFDKKDEAASDKPPSMGDVLRTIVATPTLIHLTMAYGLAAFGVYGTSFFIPLYFTRALGMNIAETGLAFGLITAFSGAFGPLLSGVVADRIGRGDARAYTLVPALGFALSIPLMILAAFMSSWPVVIGLLFLGRVALAMHATPIMATAMNLVDTRMRASMTALLFLFNSVIGVGLGPYLAGVFSDAYAANAFGADYATACLAGRSLAGSPVAADCAAAATTGLRYGLITCVALIAWPLLHVLLAGRHIRADMRE